MLNVHTWLWCKTSSNNLLHRDRFHNNQTPEIRLNRSPYITITATLKWILFVFMKSWKHMNRNRTKLRAWHFPKQVKHFHTRYAHCINADFKLVENTGRHKQAAEWRCTERFWANKWNDQLISVTTENKSMHSISSAKTISIREGGFEESLCTADCLAIHS